MLEFSELLVVLNVLDKSGCFDEGSGGGGCNGAREGKKKRFVGRLGVLLLADMVFGFAMVEFLLDTRRCSLTERGITTVEDDKPNLEKRGVTS